MNEFDPNRQMPATTLADAMEASYRAEIAALRRELLWAAAALQSLCHQRRQGSESDIVTIAGDGRERRISEILDAADVLLEKSQ